MPVNRGNARSRNNRRKSKGITTKQIAIVFVAIFAVLTAILAFRIYTRQTRTT